MTKKTRKRTAKAPTEAERKAIERSRKPEPPPFGTTEGARLPPLSAESQPFVIDEPVPADGTLIRGDGGPVVYVMQDGKKRPLQNALVFAACGFGWNEIVVLSPEEIDAIPVGDVVARQADLKGSGA